MKVSRGLGLALVAASLCGCHQKGATVTDFEAIHDEMTRAEVDRALQRLGPGGPLQSSDEVRALASGIVLARYGTPTHALFVGFDNSGRARQRSLRLPTESRDELLGAETFDPTRPPERPRMQRAEPIPEGIYAADDIHALCQGKWRLTRSVFDGEDLHHQLTWTFGLDQLSVQTEMGAPTRLYYRLDPTKSPKRFATGPLLLSDGRGANSAGIYELDHDTLKVCVDQSTRGYPERFDAPKGSHLLLQEFQRE